MRWPSAMASGTGVAEVLGWPSAVMMLLALVLGWPLFCRESLVRRLTTRWMRSRLLSQFKASISFLSMKVEIISPTKQCSKG